MLRAAPATTWTEERDPLWWCALLAGLFLALVWHRLGIPHKIYFDEVHYVPAARKLLAGVRANPEHPMFAKEVLAAAIRLLGDYPQAWRVPSALLGAAGLFAFGRLVWFVSGRGLAALLAIVLVATDFAWFIQSRIAMLDMTMAALGMIGLWLAASAMRLPDQARPRLAGAGVALGLAVASKWSVVPAGAFPGLVFAGWKAWDCRARFAWARGGGPVPGVALWEAALWLGALPLAVYWLTFWPGFLWTKGAIPWSDPIGWHRYMLGLQDSVVKLHPYRSVWYQWMGDWRSIWYLYERVDGAQRGVVLIGNPVSMILGLPAVLWCLFATWRWRRWDMGAMSALYLLSLAMWPLSGKPIQFYYHYLLPGTFLMGCLALTIEPLLKREDWWFWAAPLVLAAILLAFGWFYPIISAAELVKGPQAYADWMWLKSWR
ncbi:phospholipid carrier-dependent glycosyltransferase [Parablastomonas sp. CN1-191]|uniref:phospholipid carrier-dependent glycosyltransferase n=1 Tax=Parablastomonas sp. CN1-191 TaxID=3400908 RepID=UPI003BF86161